MNAYEASDLLNGVISNLLAGQALTISTISAYLVVAYTVGENLTKYQVWFINITFILFALIGLMGATSQMQMVFEYSAIKMEQLGGPSQYETPVEIGKWLTVGVRVLLTAGALIFMWQVRHPKTK